MTAAATKRTTARKKQPLHEAPKKRKPARKKSAPLTVTIKNRQLTKNFNISEFRCKDGTDVPDSLECNVQILAENLQILRDECTKEKRRDCPIHVNSGYRTPRYNATLEGAAAQSKHIKAEAADLTAPFYTPRQLADKIELLIRAGKMKQGGLGRYKGFTHYDIRGTRARWGRN